MKKAISLLLAVVLSMLLTDCGSSGKPETAAIKFCDTLKTR